MSYLGWGALVIWLVLVPLRWRLFCPQDHRWRSRTSLLLDPRCQCRGRRPHHPLASQVCSLTHVFFCSIFVCIPFHLRVISVFHVMSQNNGVVHHHYYSVSWSNPMKTNPIQRSLVKGACASLFGDMTLTLNCAKSP